MEEVNRLTAKRNMVLADLKENLNQAQNHMRQQVNKHRRDIQFEVGDRAYLKIKPYKLKSLAKRVNQKFSPRFYGPYEVVEKINPAAYKLKLPEGSLVQPVFHISGVKSQPLPSFLSDEWELKDKPEEVLTLR